MKPLTVLLALAFGLAACAGEPADTTDTTATSAPSSTPTTAVSESTTTAPARTTTTQDPVIEEIRGTWFRWGITSRGAGVTPLHNHFMLQFARDGRQRAEFRQDSQDIQNTNWHPFEFDGELLTIQYSTLFDEEECDEPGVYRLRWLSESKDHFRLEVVDDECEQRMATLDTLSGPNGDFPLTWRIRTSAVARELQSLNDAILAGGPFERHPDSEGPILGGG